jgi:uncharacterized glyoxalase superfamily protein PhnB
MAHSARSSTRAESTARAIVPTIPYRDAMAMVAWLSDAYGFEKRRVVKGENDELQYAQLAFGEHMIMVVQAQDSKLERLVVHPDQIGGVETQACYLVVSDIDAHHVRATAHGAETVSGIEGRDGGDRRYASRDPEGHIWMFGTYNPYEGRQPVKSDHQHRNRGSGRRTALAAGVCALSIVAIAAGFWTYADRLAAFKPDAPRLAAVERRAPQGADVDARPVGDELQQVRAAQESIERKLLQTRAALETATRAEKDARDALAQEMRARDAFARTGTQAEDQLRQERIARSAAERAARDATDQLARAQLAKGTAERLAKEMTEKWELERRTRGLAEQSAQSAMAEVARERSAKAAAELAAAELRNQLAGTGPAPQGILAFRDQFEAERRVRERLERAAKDAQLQLAQEKFSRDATERALKQVQDRLEQTQDRLASASCWACPSGAPCARP